MVKVKVKVGSGGSSGISFKPKVSFKPPDIQSKPKTQEDIKVEADVIPNTNTETDLIEKPKLENEQTRGNRKFKLDNMEDSITPEFKIRINKKK